MASVLSLPEFQSLFFWIHFYNRVAIIRIRSVDLVSILVFLDSLLQRASGRCDPAAKTWFQSLFFWIHFYNLVRH